MNHQIDCNLLYGSIDEFRCDLRSRLTNDKLNIAQINMRSIKSFERFDVFKSLIDEIKELDVIIVSESWLDKYSFKYYNCLPNFEGFFDGRNYGCSGGGVAIFVKKYLQPRSIQTPKDKDFNAVWVEVSNEKFGVFNVAGYYRPGWVDVNELFTDMESFMNKFGSSNCFVGGDVNIDVLVSNNVTDQYINLLNSFGFSISNDKRTRVKTGTLLDHAVTNFSEKFDIMNSTIDTDFSDHSIVISEVSLPIESEPLTFSKAFTNFELFKMNLIENLAEETSHESDVNSYCNFIIDSLNAATVASTEIINVHKRKKDLLCPWMNVEVKRLSSYKKDKFSSKSSKFDDSGE